MGVEEETSLLTRYCFSLISLGTYALRLCLVCVVDVRVRLRSSVGILEGALDLTADLCKALFLHSFRVPLIGSTCRAMQGTDIDLHCGFVPPTMALRFLSTGSGAARCISIRPQKTGGYCSYRVSIVLILTDCNHCCCSSCIANSPSEPSGRP